MNSVEEREIIRQFSGFLATALGEGWSVDTSERFADYPGVYLDGPQGVRLYVRLYVQLNWRNADRAVISGVYPEGGLRLYGVQRHEISVSRFRDVGAIARDVIKRLLPGYVTELEDVRRRLVEADEYEAGRRALARRLSAILEPTGDGRMGTSVYAPGMGTFEVQGPDSVSLERFYVPAEIAVLIAEVIAAHPIG